MAGLNVIQAPQRLVEFYLETTAANPRGPVCYLGLHSK
jgi:hypothetical protein